MGEAITFEVPNLDGLNEDELEAISKVYLRLSDAVMNLRRYVNLRKQAILFRENGTIEYALNVERLMDKVYQDLPVWATW